MKTVTLKRLSICPCGYRTLHDSIELGTKYQVTGERLDGYKYVCGRCKQEQQVSVYLAASRTDPDVPYAPIPSALFEVAA